MQAIGSETVRRDAWLKVEGKARYNDDYTSPSCLQARLLTSTYAHAKIAAIDVSGAYTVPGVHAVVTGESGALLGSIVQDMPALASGVVRYFGEPVALVVADEEWQAAQAAKLIKVKYDPLPVVSSLEDALRADAALIHPDLKGYNSASHNVQPEPDTNISNRIRIRKGNMPDGWSKSDVIVEGVYNIPQASHAYIETRNARARVSPDGSVEIYSATQAPHATRALIAKAFSISEGSIIIHAPFLGGAYGGKVNAHPDVLAYMASLASGGKEVRVSMTREESFFTCPCKVGAKAVLKMGADRGGRIQALKADIFIDSGAYADTTPVIARAAAANCSGVYNIPNIECDSVSVYTNHVYGTSFRGFGHDVSTFVVERTIDKLAAKLGMDAAEVRYINALHEGDYTPTQVKVTPSNTGNVSACIKRLKEIMEWDKGALTHTGGSIIKAKGIACFSKTSSSPTDAISSAVLTFCSDGCVNLNCGVVECGQGSMTALPLIVAERLKISPGRVFVNMQVDTRVCPEHWKTVASMSTFIAGNAAVAAADDAVRQLKSNAALALRCGVRDIEFDGEKAYLIEDPDVYVELKNIVFGVKTAEGNALGGPVIGRGHYVMQHLSTMDTQTGRGKPGPYWTVGAQAVEIEYDSSDYTYRLLRGAAVIDAGKVVQPGCASGQVIGAMNTGLSVASREEYRYAADGELKDSSFRTYKVMHYAENPEYTVEFIETPNLGSPYGIRGIAEHGILGMAPALAGALGRAAGVEFDSLPITYESVWNAAYTHSPEAK